jgi:hypothetical protein
MPTKIALCTIALLSALLVGCEDNRTAAFCEAACECLDDNDAQECAGECTQDIESLESFNSGPPIVSDACFACVDHNTCQNIFTICSSECAVLFQALQNGPQPQPGDPNDTN